MFMGKKAELTYEGWKGCCKAKKLRGFPLTSVTSAQSRMIQYPWVWREGKTNLIIKNIICAGCRIYFALTFFPK